MNILVVEDDADLRVEIVEYLERRHHRVIACGTVAAARAALGESDHSPLGAAVCDVSLPDGDGVDFFVESAVRFPDCRWVLMSGGHDLERLDRQLDGFARRPVVLEKPLPLRSLDEALEGASKR